MHRSDYTAARRLQQQIPLPIADVLALLKQHGSPQAAIAVILISTEPFDLIRCRLPAQGRKNETAPALPISLFKSSLHIKINRQKTPLPRKNPL